MSWYDVSFFQTQLISWESVLLAKVTKEGMEEFMWGP